MSSSDASHKGRTYGEVQFLLRTILILLNIVTDAEDGSVGKEIQQSTVVLRHQSRGTGVLESKGKVQQAGKFHQCVEKGGPLSGADTFERGLIERQYDLVDAQGLLTTVPVGARTVW